VDLARWQDDGQPALDSAAVTGLIAAAFVGAFVGALVGPFADVLVRHPAERLAHRLERRR
jgi:hypothetical protein